MKGRALRKSTQCNYDLRVTGYVTKPEKLEEFRGIVKSIEGFRRILVKLPD
jgi:hypothetical protein